MSETFLGSAVRVGDGKVISGVPLHLTDALAPDGGPKPVGVEIVDAGAEVIDPCRFIACLYDD